MHTCARAHRHKLRGPPGCLSWVTGCCPPPAPGDPPPLPQKKELLQQHTQSQGPVTPVTEAVGGTREEKSPPESAARPHHGAGVQKQGPPRLRRPCTNACTFYQSKVSLINTFSSPLPRSLIWPEAAQSFKKQNKRQRRKTQVPRGEPGWQLSGHSPEPPCPWCFRTQPDRSGSLLSKRTATAGPNGGGGP